MERAANPDKCYCGDERQMGEVVGTEEVEMPPYFDPNKKVAIEVVRCLRCGKRFLNMGAWA